MNESGTTTKPLSSGFARTKMGSVPPLRTTNDVVGRVPAGGTREAIGAGSDTRRSAGLRTLPTVTRREGDHGPTEPQEASARTWKTYSPGAPVNESAPPSTTHSRPSGSKTEVRRMRNLSPVSPPPGPAPVPSVSQVTTHVEKAGGFGGFAWSSPTEGGTSQTLFTGTATTFDTMPRTRPWGTRT